MAPRGRVKSALTLARQSFKQRGWSGLTRDGRNFLAFNILGATTDFTQQRYRLSEALALASNFTVQYGPFAGMRFAQESWWSAADRGSMILGMYEQEVLKVLDDNHHGRDILVDVGAADGYYAIGCLKAGWVRHAYCFELSEHGRAAIRRNAELNQCAANITILGEARPGFMAELEHKFNINPKQVFMIMDIEGGEADLLTASALQSLSRSVSVVELHENQLAPSFITQFESSAAKAGLEITYVRTQDRNPSAYPELASWSDDDRWMLCSEGRAQLMRWAILQPGRQ
jgi:hypothetical protein